MAISLAAGFSGAIAAAASHSFDTARTRAQCVILPKVKEQSHACLSHHLTKRHKTQSSLLIFSLFGFYWILAQYTAKERKFLRWNKPGKRLERWTGIHPTDRNLLFRGIGLRMARSSVASTVIVGSYYLAVDLLVSK